MGIILLLIGAFLYFLPTIIGRKKRNAGAIGALNLLAGWTIVGWIIAFVWAATKDPEPQVVVVRQ
jgi:uncharacterized membrane protein HdeD (DUF308 family)